MLAMKQIKLILGILLLYFNTFDFSGNEFVKLSTVDACTYYAWI